MYHTKLKIMVNGGDATSFALEHAKITDSILSSEDVNQLDKEYSGRESTHVLQINTKKTNQHSISEQT